MDRIEQIARVCHEANRAYCATIGDTSQVGWEEAPEWQKKSAIAGVACHLATMMAGKEPMPEDSHESWLLEKAKEGWAYGPIKDPEKKEYPCFVPFEKLPPEQKVKDFIFVAIVVSMVRSYPETK